MKFLFKIHFDNLIIAIQIKMKDFYNSIYINTPDESKMRFAFLPPKFQILNQGLKLRKGVYWLKIIRERKS